MAFVDLASNQMVSFTDAQSSGFPLNGGQSHVTSNQLMSKSDALTKYALSSSAMNGYADNQLVPKGVWQSTGVTSYPYLTSIVGDSTSALSCAFINDYNLSYSSTSTLTVGMVLHNNSSLTAPFNGMNLYYRSGDINSTLRVNTSGVVTEIVACP